ncbi:unnamed protein product [Amoebophrya sp. A120]|nr:unnamed protein product [Amoebophrya sp. A120]|eukprot:GSA120T00011513001.1
MGNSPCCLTGGRNRYSQVDESEFIPENSLAWWDRVGRIGSERWQDLTRFIPQSLRTIWLHPGIDEFGYYTSDVTTITRNKAKRPKQGEKRKVLQIINVEKLLVRVVRPNSHGEIALITVPAANVFFVNHFGHQQIRLGKLKNKPEYNNAKVLALEKPVTLLCDEYVADKCSPPTALILTADKAYQLFQSPFNNPNIPEELLLKSGLSEGSVENFFGDVEETLRRNSYDQEEMATLQIRMDNLTNLNEGQRSKRKRLLRRLSEEFANRSENVAPAEDSAEHTEIGLQNQQRI